MDRKFETGQEEAITDEDIMALREKRAGAAWGESTRNSPVPNGNYELRVEMMARVMENDFSRHEGQSLEQREDRVQRLIVNITGINKDLGMPFDQAIQENIKLLDGGW